MTDAPNLRENWYRLDVEPGFDLDQSGIIEWRIEGQGIDVGSTKDIHGRIRQFEANLRNMLAGKHYHGDPDGEYRAVHHAIRHAYERQSVITVTVLEICAPEVLRARKAHWLERRRAEEQAGGPKVLTKQ